MKRGDTIEVRAHKSDGTVYRWWRAMVESCDAERIVLLTRCGTAVGGPCGGWSMKHTARAVYWFDRPYNLHELYQPDGRLKQIYIHIASPARLHDGVLSYTDYELDVVKRPGQPLRVVDEDEFVAATSEYGYSAEFCGACRQAVHEALALAECWRPSGPPVFTSNRRSRFPGRRRGRHPVRTDTPGIDSSTRSTEV